MGIDYYKKYEPIMGAWYIKKAIGSGGFGHVFEIERTDFGGTYKAALKAIRIPRTSDEIRKVMTEGMDEDGVTLHFKGIVEELVSEFVLMSKLKGNSNVVSYEDHIVKEHDDGIGWDILIRMELLTPLEERIGEGLQCKDVIRLGIDMCRALELCQKYNIIHRDIKPENIFISQLGDYKLGDFGIAKTTERLQANLSRKGTVPYMAPEIYRGEAYTSSVDIYSLGIVLYQLLNYNRLPFCPPAPMPYSHIDKNDAFIKRISGAPLPPPAYATGRLAEIVLKACSYKPEERYSSPLQMRQELESIAYTTMETEHIYPRGDKVLHKGQDDSTSGADLTEILPSSDPELQVEKQPLDGELARKDKPPVGLFVSLVFFLLTAIVGLFLYKGYLIQPTPAETVAEIFVWQEQAFEAAVRKSLDLQDGELLKELLENIQILEVVDANITTLADLVHLPNLEILDLSSNQISDLSPLRSLSNLREINLGFNNISNIEILGHLANLEKINLESNPLRDITPLTNLNKLESVELGDGNFIMAGY